MPVKRGRRGEVACVEYCALHDRGVAAGVKRVVPGDAINDINTVVQGRIGIIWTRARLLAVVFRVAAELLGGHGTDPAFLVCLRIPDLAAKLVQPGICEVCRKRAVEDRLREVGTVAECGVKFICIRRQTSKALEALGKFYALQRRSPLEAAPVDELQRRGKRDCFEVCALEKSVVVNGGHAFGNRNLCNGRGMECINAQLGNVRRQIHLRKLCAVGEAVNIYERHRIRQSDTDQKRIRGKSSSADCLNAVANNNAHEVWAGAEGIFADRLYGMPVERLRRGEVARVRNRALHNHGVSISERVVPGDAVNHVNAVVQSRIGIVWPRAGLVAVVFRVSAELLCWHCASPAFLAGLRVPDLAAKLVQPGISEVRRQRAVEYRLLKA